MYITTKRRYSDRVLFWLATKSNYVIFALSVLIASYITMLVASPTPVGDKYEDETNMVVIYGPAGTWKIKGADQILSPLIHEAHRMNSIESWENHMQGDPRKHPYEYD
ncbi:MAG: hypothetical protein GF411_13910 [Candidatus Lokiarchaeota archaeon]|nr:hypothetical protein [Candidatus Lokiarchaeota archaeon]